MFASRSQRIGLIIFLVIYVAAGVFTTVRQLIKLPLSDSLFMDFGFYDAALQRVRSGGDMYAIRGVGEAYLYPHQALLAVELTDFLPGKLARGAFLAVLDVVLIHVFGHLSILAVIFVPVKNEKLVMNPA